MHPRILNIPIPFTGNFVPIHSYGFMMMLGFLAGIYLARGRARREGIEPSFVMDLATICLLSGILGSRIAYVLESPGEFSWALFNIFDGGLSLVGAVIGGVGFGALAFHVPLSKEKKPRSAMVAVSALLGSLIAARVFYVAWNGEEYTYAFEIFKVYRGGLSFYGGLILATASGVYYIRKNNQSLPPIADIVAPSIAIGLGFGRVGCFLNGCCFGKVTRSIIGIKFPGNSREVPSPAWKHHCDLGLISSKHPQSLPVHPSQIYHAMAAVLLFAILAVYYRRRRTPGQVFLLFGVLYTSIRFLLEFYRGDMEPLACGLTTYQALAIPVFIICAIWWSVLQFREQSEANAE